MTSLMWWAATVTLSSFAIVAMAASIAIALAAPMLARRSARYSPAARAAFLFRLRLVPTACAVACAFGVALPIFLYFEPSDSGERLAWTLMIAAVAGAVLLARGFWRAAAGWMATRRLMRGWQARGRRLHTFDAPLPVFAIEESFPTVAVVGFSRPALFIAERVLRECSVVEVRAMVRHECAHVASRDNLKQFLIRACPDVLRPNSTIDRAWTSAAEEAADARAAGGDPASALALAEALIRVARLAPRVRALEVASAFYLGGSIESRVRRLVEPSDSLPDPSRPLGCVIACAGALAFAGTVALAAPAIHQVMEAAVRFLP